MKEQETELTSSSAQNLDSLPIVCASVSQSVKCRHDCDTNPTGISKIGLDFALGRSSSPKQSAYSDSLGHTFSALT